MKRTILIISALCFPWVVLAYYRKILGALISMILQVTVIGWPFASIWAIQLINEETKPHKHPHKKEKMGKAK